MAGNGSIAEVNAKSFSELLSGPLVDVYVGKDKKHWALHRNLLSYHSEHLRSELEPPQLNDGSPPSKKKNSPPKDEPRLELLKEDPAGFELFIKWTYQGTLDDVDSIQDDHAKYEYAVACHKLYNLCNRLEMPALGNVAIDQYRKGLHTTSLVPDAEEIDQIYRASPVASPFRRLMTKIAARQIMDPDSEKDAESYRHCFENNPDFCIDLVNAIKDGTGGFLFDDPTDSAAGDECDYHDHSNGPNCHVKKKGRAEPAPSKQTPKSDGALNSIIPSDKKRQQRPFRPPKEPSQPPDPPTSVPTPAAKPAVPAKPNGDTSSPGVGRPSPPTPPPSPPKRLSPPITPQRSVSFAAAPSSRPPPTPTPGRTVSALAPGALPGILKPHPGTPTPLPRSASSTTVTGRPAPFTTPDQPQSRTANGPANGPANGARSAPAKNYAGSLQQPAGKSPLQSMGALAGTSPAIYSTPPTSVASNTSNSDAGGSGRRRPPKLRRNTTKTNAKPGV